MGFVEPEQEEIATLEFCVEGQDPFRALEFATADAALGLVADSRDAERALGFAEAREGISHTDSMCFRGSVYYRLHGNMTKSSILFRKNGLMLTQFDLKS